MKRNTFAVICLIAALCAIYINPADAASNAPGSAADPLVSQSYVDDRYEKLLTIISGIESPPYISEGGGGFSEEDRNSIMEEILYQVEYMFETYAATGNTYTPVFAYSGQIILGGEGTEIILRSGTAVVYVTGQNGLSDITSGREIMNGGIVEQDHMLIVSRNDGRGVRINSDAWFLIKGAYTIIY